MNEKYFAIRKIKNGRVKVGGVWFVPDEKHMKYDGRLDGQIWAFGRYPQGNKYMDLLELWGTREEYYAKDEATIDRLWAERKNKDVVGGYFVWAFWHSEKPTAKI